MDKEDKGKQFSIGRGNILLKLMKEKEKSENITVSQTTLDTSTTSNIPPLIEISSSSTIGLGRATLLNKLKAIKSTTEVPDPKPIQIDGQGRGSLLSRLKAVSLSAKPSEQPSISIQSSNDAGVLGKLSDITKQETKQLSELPHSTSQPKHTQGTGGKPIQLSGNYINLKVDPNKGLFSYEIKFHPDIDSRPLRRKLLNQHLQSLGRTKVFDGAILFLPKKLEENITIFESTHPMDGSTVKLTLIYKKQQDMSGNILFFNVLLGRVMRALSLVRIGQHSFNPKGIQSIPQHKLEVWPGYVTAISSYNTGLKLRIDARHRVIRTETVRDLMVALGRKPQFKAAVVRELIGLSVLTRYNNRTYRIDDIAWDKNPTHIFDRGTDKISIIDYYKYNWNLDIKDKEQPLLVNCAKKKLSSGETQEQLIFLVPELCYVASLSDSIRTDFRVMKDLDALTKLTPNARHNVIRHFIEEVKNNDVPREILAEWGLELESDIVEFSGRVLDHETIYFGKNVKFLPPPDKPAEWSSAVCRNTLLRAVNLNCWCILHCQKDTRCTLEFITMLRKVGKVMGIIVKEPQVICLRDDKIETYVQTLRNNIKDIVNLMVIIFPTSRTDRFSAVKRTISRGDKLKSITEKIALQINCKLGGALWALPIPMENCMICGIDVYHAGIGSSMKCSVAGFVASLDKLLTSWYSKVCLQGRHQELIDMLQMCFISAIKAYYKVNRIIVYRDGVGDGQLDTVSKYEVKQLLTTLETIEPSYQPTLTVIVVQKRISTRLFEKFNTGLRNPPPGTVVDSYITKPNLYDFFLISQNIRQGTVSPIHYIVIYDNKNMNPEHVQRLTYKLCHLYYNWSGTIKIPAPCQYAHKLVYLVGQHIQLEPHQSLSNMLYYL
ncbi:Piwi-like protein 1 [Eufriesea mexicana]|nr:Piwi-like protein 1 [Eufriesea mexicana]